MLKINRKLFDKEKSETSSIAASSAPAQAYDRVFTEAFKTTFIAHLQQRAASDVSEQDEKINQPWRVVEQAKINQVGKLSRIFDQLDLSPMEQAESLASIKSAGSMSNFLRPMIQELSTVLFNENRTELSNEVRTAIGEENYDAITRLTNNGEPVTDETIAQRKAEIVQNVAAAIILCYSQAIQKYNLTERQQSLHDLVRDPRKDALIEKIQQNNGGKKFELLQRSIVNVEVNSDNEESTMAAFNEALQHCADLAADANSSLRDQIIAFRECEAISRGINDYVGSKSITYMTNYMVPLQNIATNFDLEAFLAAAPERDPEIAEHVADKEASIEQGLQALASRIDMAQQGLFKLSSGATDENKTKINKLGEQLKKLEARLKVHASSVADTPEQIANKLIVYNEASRKLNDAFIPVKPLVDDWVGSLQVAVGTLSDITDQTANNAVRGLRDNLNMVHRADPFLRFEGANIATNRFAATVSNWEIEPPKPVMNLVLRIFRAIGLALTTGKFSLTTDTEQEEKTRFVEQSIIKQSLVDFKKSELEGRQIEEKPPSPTRRP